MLIFVQQEFEEKKGQFNHPTIVPMLGSFGTFSMVIYRLFLSG